MTWYADYYTRRDRLVRDGLLVLVRGAHIDAATGFVSIIIEANEGDLLRSNADRGFGLHLTWGFETDYAAGVAREAVVRLNERWAGRLVRLRIGWVGGGGSVQLAKDDELAMDPDVWWLHSRGWYGSGINVLPRGLHVSL